MGASMVTNVVFGSPALLALLELRATGVRFRLEGDRLLVSPRGALTAKQRELFQRHQEAVRALVTIITDGGVTARCDAFRRQLEATPAPRVPAFVFRFGVPYVRGVCFSCGDGLS